jgi:hypothetical protein
MPPIQLTHTQKVQYLIMALALQQVQVNEVVADAIVTTYEGILEKGGEYSLKDIAKVFVDVSERNKPEQTEKQS